MPEAVENGSFIPTLDQRGAIWLFTDEITQEYLKFVKRTRGTCLEVACGYGHVVIQALEAGAARVFANEIDARQLRILEARLTAEQSQRVVCCAGQFPEEVELPDAQFDAILSARLFHFFDAERIREGLQKLYRWLKPGGRLFLVNDAIYRTIFKPLIPEYEVRVAAGVEWPGFIADVRGCLPEYLHPENFPRTMNFMDPPVLRRELERARFEVLEVRFCAYTGNFALGRMDGRELAAGIGVKK